MIEPNMYPWRRGCISRYLPSFGGVRTFSSSSILSLGMDQEIHPSRQGRIDSVKINPSLPMMRECPYTTKTREVLGNPSPPPCTFPRASIFESREIFWASGMDFPIPPSSWWSTDTFPILFEVSLPIKTFVLFSV